MSAGELLTHCRSRGIALSAGPGGTLCWEADADPPAELLAGLAKHKEELLAILGPPAVPTVPAARWDQDEAEALLADVRGAISHAEAEQRAGRMPEVRLSVVRLWAEVAEGFVADRESEARRGWDALELLKSAAGQALRAAGRAKPS